MKITKKLSRREAVELTNNIQDVNDIENSNLSEWFKGTYGVCLMALKPKLYNQKFPDVDIEKALAAFKERFNPKNKEQSNGAFTR